MTADFSLDADQVPSVLAGGQQACDGLWRHSDYKAYGGHSDRLDHQGSENRKGKITEKKRESEYGMKYDWLKCIK